MPNGPLLKTNIFGFKVQEPCQFEFHIPLSLFHFPLLPLVRGHITFRCAQGCDSGISANAGPCLFDHASDSCIASGLILHSVTK